jgi:hypothetical protein
MRVFVMALSIAAGALFFWLLAKVLFFGLALVALAGLFSFIRRRRYAAYAYRYHYGAGGYNNGSSMGYYRRQAEPLAPSWSTARNAEPLGDYRLIQVG